MVGRQVVAGNLPSIVNMVVNQIVTLQNSVGVFVSIFFAFQKSSTKGYTAQFFTFVKTFLLLGDKF